MKNSTRTSWPSIVRFGFWLALLLAVLSGAGLVYEWINFAQSIPGTGWNAQFVRLVLLGGANLAATVLWVVMLLLFAWSRAAKSLPELRGWHRERPQSEFTFNDATPHYSLKDYLDQEERIFDELDGYISGSWKREKPATFCRYDAGSVCNPNTISDRNWNRSHLLINDHPVGGVLLIHGLSDSPYSLRVLGNRLHAEGYTVLWLRVPGHGTAPKALADVHWKDWTAAVEVAAKGLRAELPDNSPLIVAGYSNGGALAVDYALSALEDPALPNPNGVLLFSPMIGINPLARITQLYHAVAVVSRNSKAQWSSIFAEIDPFKYSSWPMNANVQAWNVTQSVARKLAALKKSNRMRELPPILAMQSVVDSTVAVPKLITELFDRLTDNDSELFLFDVNRIDWFDNLLNRSFEASVLPILKQNQQNYRLSVLQNTSPNSPELMIRTRANGRWAETPVAGAWPDNMISLSHVAVPFPAEDPIYGDGSINSGLSLGKIQLRAEPSALMIPSSLFVRCRFNPFYEFMEDRIVDWLSTKLPQTSSQENSEIDHP